MVLTVISSTECLLNGPPPVVDPASSSMILATKIMNFQYPHRHYACTKMVNKSPPEFIFYSIDDSNMHSTNKSPGSL